MNRKLFEEAAEVLEELRKAYTQITGLPAVRANNLLPRITAALAAPEPDAMEVLQQVPGASENDLISAKHLAGFILSQTKRTYPGGTQEVLPAYNVETATELIESCFAAIRSDERQKAAKRAIVYCESNRLVKGWQSDLRTAIMADTEEADHGNC